MGRFAHKLKIGVRGSLDVLLEQTSLKTGDVVSGSVRLVVDKPITTRGLNVTIAGRERLYWEHSDDSGPHPHRRALDLLDEKRTLIDPLTSPDEKVSVECCDREYPFNFELPSHLPATFEYKCRRIKGMERVRVYVEYFVTATLLVDGFLKADLECVIPITVDSTKLPRQLTPEPVTVTKHNDVKLFGLIRQGSVDVKMAISSNVLDPKSIIIATVDIDNSSKRELESLRLCLVEDICVDRHRKRFNRTRASYRDVCCRLYDKSLLGMINSDSRSMLKLHLPVTPNDIYEFGPLLPTMKSHFIVSLGYRVVLDCKFQLSQRVKIDIPVIVVPSTSRIVAPAAA
ncbi:hypothetical protein Poli38472_010153 [Pythium oligandrum]|uniref:Arrestin C-terminal-like domain-containing protein n=1 Tax=Pythium oligandrum TaxID=41045 RepID=A0A8K1C8U6_PYTOL|nr:hypothetical protein Poli38472_010153 [Pythium oligandrum]|eukprot:TMW58594.1 hypothetical protein Poli38472_010153 [Pythium oligandrum]